jgi:DNA-binding HxlR family transcriptional regulator
VIGVCEGRNYSRTAPAAKNRHFLFDKPWSRNDVEQNCSKDIDRISRVIAAVRGRWTLQVLCAMRSRSVRLSQLTRLFPLASKKGLRASLRSLEAAGIVTRRDLSHSVLHVEYDFADEKRTIICLLLDRLAELGAFLEGKQVALPDSDDPSTIHTK